MAGFLPEKYTILITGGTGMIGKALKVGHMCAYMDQDIQLIKVGSKDYDLRDEDAVARMFWRYRPDAVIHLAARVGGVKANTEKVADFYTENILINTNIINVAHLFKTKRVVSVLSSCIYPDPAPEILHEEDLHMGPPHDSNFGYAYAKRMLEVQGRAYNQQYGYEKFVCVVPTNIYGPHDNFDLENGHVIPAIIRKIYEAKENPQKIPVFWGSGSPLRQFTYVDDIARVIMAAAIYHDTPPVMNIGVTKENSIRYAVESVAKYLEYYGPIKWDATKPEGQSRKPICCGKMDAFLERHDLNRPFTCLQDGLKKTCDWFVENYPNVRGVNV